MNKLDDKAVRYETSVNQLNRVLGNRLNTSLSGAFKAGYKEAIKEACEWLKAHAKSYGIVNDCVLDEQLCNNFRKAMEE